MRERADVAEHAHRRVLTHGAGVHGDDVRLVLVVGHRIVKRLDSIRNFGELYHLFVGMHELNKVRRNCHLVFFGVCADKRVREIIVDVTCVFADLFRSRLWHRHIPEVAFVLGTVLFGILKRVACFALPPVAVYDHCGNHSALAVLSRVNKVVLRVVVTVSAESRFFVVILTRFYQFFDKTQSVINTRLTEHVVTVIVTYSRCLGVKHDFSVAVDTDFAVCVNRDKLLAAAEIDTTRDILCSFVIGNKRFE